MHQRRWMTLGVICLSLMVIGLDNTILNVALPTLGRTLHATTSSLQWIVDSYTLVLAGPSVLDPPRCPVAIRSALIRPATLSIPTHVFNSPVDRARASGIWAGVSAVG